MAHDDDINIIWKMLIAFSTEIQIHYIIVTNITLNFIDRLASNNAQLNTMLLLHLIDKILRTNLQNYVLIVLVRIFTERH